MRKYISILFIVAGFLTMAYPQLNLAYSRYMQEKVLVELEQGTLMASTTVQPNTHTERETRVRSLEDVLEPELSRDETPSPEESTSETLLSDTPQPTAIGILNIPDISLRMPIYHGTSNAILKIGVGQLEWTAPIGTTGNAVLAAHRSYTYGHQFNRLDELDVRDEISITIGQQNYIYSVYKSHIVEADDTTVLVGNDSDKGVTLYTCHPISTGTHRLIVHALQISP